MNLILWTLAFNKEFKKKVNFFCVPQNKNKTILNYNFYIFGQTTILKVKHQY